MSLKPNNISAIIVITYKGDYSLAKICIASIRYFYPKFPIYIIKDYINGRFSTYILERYFKVQVLDLGVSKFGWTSAKMFLYATKKLPRGKYLILDADTVFIGRVIEILNKYSSNTDFVVSKSHVKRNSRNCIQNYFDIDKISKIFPEYEYSGYMFNTGQLVISAQKLSFSDFKPYFKKYKYPYWSQRYVHLFPRRDQSLLNIILPIMEKKNKIKLTWSNFMKWSESNYIKKNLKLDEVKSGKYSFIIHWAGSKKNNLISKMTRGDILEFFNKYYYSNIPFGKTTRTIRSISKKYFFN